MDDLLDEAAVDGVGERLGLELRLGASVRGGTAVSFVVTLGLDDGSADVVPLSLGRVDDVPWPGDVGCGSLPPAPPPRPGMDERWWLSLPPV